MPLGATSLAQARPAIRAALVAAAKQNAFQSWSVRQQKRGLKEAVCRRDELPQVDSVDLTSFLPFLALSV